MPKRDDGGPAFPRVGNWPDLNNVDHEDLHAALATKTEPQDGMTLRDFFAAKALAAIYESSDGETTYDEMADSAYSIADAMLKARES